MPISLLSSHRTSLPPDYAAQPQGSAPARGTHAGSSSPSQGSSAPHRHLRPPSHSHGLQDEYLRKGQQVSRDYYKKQIATWASLATETFLHGDDEMKRKSLQILMEDFFRPPGALECTQAGELNKTLERKLHSSQLKALKIIEKRSSDLDGRNRYLLLASFISNFLEHMGTSVDASRDAQRQSIKVLSEVMDTIAEPNNRAKLLVRLMEKFNSGGIKTDRFAKGMLGRPGTVSDVTLQLIERELKVARSSYRRIDQDTLQALQRCYDRTILTYDPTVQGETPLHTKAWRDVFRNKYLNPAKFGKWESHTAKLMYAAKKVFGLEGSKDKVDRLHGKLKDEVSSRGSMPRFADARTRAWVDDLNSRQADSKRLDSLRDELARWDEGLETQSAVSADLERQSTTGNGSSMSMVETLQMRNRMQQRENEYWEALNALGILNPDGSLNREIYRKAREGKLVPEEISGRAGNSSASNGSWGGRRVDGNVRPPRNA